MTQCAMGYLAKLMGSAHHSARASKISVALDAHIKTVHANPREQKHAAALHAWCDGNLDGTCRLWEDILLDHPTDSLARHDRPQ